MLINIKNNFVKFFLNSCIFFSLLLFIFPINAHERNDDWKDVLKEASGQTIYFHAWGGAKNINSYIKWASDEVKKKYNINVKHVKVSDTANVVAKILSEKNVKKNNNGTVDLVWINGENFSFMKTNDLLLNEKWIFNSPNSKFLDFANNPSLLNDFGIPTDGMEMPWGVSQLNFYYDTKYIKSPPKSALELKNYIIKNKGRFTFPQPPDFVGTSFLKQILIELISDRNFLKSNYIANKHERELEPLWQWLEEVTPYLWRNGKNYPSNYLAMTELVAEREIDFGIAFNIAHASNSISEGKLSNSVRSYIHDKGTLANVHFLAIPYNSSNKAASRAFVDFLISPKAQIKKQNKDFWGDPSVISINKLSQKWRNKFSTLPRGVATLTNKDLKVKLEEPHPSWVKIIEDKWIKKYGSNN
jgi:putative thiamine transport system substrate-binding protein